MAAMAQEKSRERRVERDRRRFSGRVEKSLPVPGVEPLRAAHKCNRWASYRFAICGTAACDGIGLPACARKQPRLPVPVAAAPMTNLCLDSNDFARRACA